MCKTLLAALSLAVLLGGIPPSKAESWPQRPVRIITPFPPGSGIDVAARVFADRLAARWGQPVTVENRPGGDGVIGVAAFVSQRDDHTLLFAGSATFTVNPVINQKLPYDSKRDIVPISSASEIFIAITASKAANATTLGELADRARAEPGKLNWSAGPGLPQYVFGAFLETSGLNMVSVSYRGLAPALQDLQEGRIHVMVQSITAVLGTVQAGKANALAIASERRAPIAINVPTVVEAGHPELTMDSLCGVFGWRDMPIDLRERVATDLRAIASEPNVQEHLAKIGQGAHASTPTEFTAYLTAARRRIVEIVSTVASQPSP